MKKQDMKKIALMGIASGLLMSGQAIAEDSAPHSNGAEGLLAHGCGGKGKCSGAHSCGGSGGGHKCSSAHSCGGSGGQELPPTEPNTTSSQGTKRGSCGANSCRGHGGLTASRDTNHSKLAESDISITVETDKPISESELLSKLNAAGKTAYNELDAEGKALAIKLASRSCKGHNDCKGLNACKSAKNSCAGQGGCKGQSSCAFKDKNTAVKVAADKMAAKRANMGS